MSDITLSGKVTTDNPIGKESPKPATRGGAKKQSEGESLLKLFEKDVPSILAKLDPTIGNQIQLANSILLVDEIKKWKEDNKDKVEEYYKNRDKEKELTTKKKYYQKNKDKILKKHKIKFICRCGKKLNLNGKSRHIKSNQHLKFMFYRWKSSVF